MACSRSQAVRPLLGSDSCQPEVFNSEISCLVGSAGFPVTIRVLGRMRVSLARRAVKLMLAKDSMTPWVLTTSDAMIPAPA